MSNLVLFVLSGLVCFIVGQYVGQKQIKKKAEFTLMVMKRGFEGYQEALGAVLKRDHSLVLEELDKLALKWSMENTANKFKDFLDKQAKDFDASKDNKGNDTPS